MSKYLDGNASNISSILDENKIIVNDIMEILDKKGINALEEEINKKIDNLLEQMNNNKNYETYTFKELQDTKENNEIIKLKNFKNLINEIIDHDNLFYEDLTFEEKEELTEFFNAIMRYADNTISQIQQIQNLIENKNKLSRFSFIIEENEKLMKEILEKTTELSNQNFIKKEAVKDYLNKINNLINNENILNKDLEEAAVKTAELYEGNQLKPNYTVK